MSSLLPALASTTITHHYQYINMIDSHALLFEHGAGIVKRATLAWNQTQTGSDEVVNAHIEIIPGTFLILVATVCAAIFAILSVRSVRVFCVYELS